jgi:NADH-quinone oxidoreductase subunit K
LPVHSASLYYLRKKMMISAENINIFSVFSLFVILLFIAGLYCVVRTRNMMRALIGIELLTKGVTVLIIVAGYVTDNVALAQSLAITLIIIEVVVIAITAGVILSIFRHTGSLDRSTARELNG